MTMKLKFISIESEVNFVGLLHVRLINMGLNAKPTPHPSAPSKKLQVPELLGTSTPHPNPFQDTLYDCLINLQVSYEPSICLPSTISSPNPPPLASSTPPLAIFPSSSGRNKSPSPVATSSSTVSMATTTIQSSTV